MITLGGGQPPCEHDRHDRVRVRVDLTRPGVPDYPIIEPPSAKQFELEIFDYAKYSNVQGFCAGREESCHALQLGQIWEGFETAIVAKILHEHPGIVLDFGAGVGWYTILAAMFDHEVLAFDAHLETCELIETNTVLNNVDHRVTVYQGWIDKNFSYTTDEDVCFLKADVEGSELQVFSACQDLFKRRRVFAAMFEISPVFNASYLELFDALDAHGYVPFTMPNKTERTSRKITKPETYLNAISQANVLFLRT